MKEMTLYEIIDKLVGNIEWTAEEHHDIKVVERLQESFTQVLEYTYILC